MKLTLILLMATIPGFAQTDSILVKELTNPPRYYWQSRTTGKYIGPAKPPTEMPNPDPGFYQPKSLMPIVENRGGLTNMPIQKGPDLPTNMPLYKPGIYVKKPK